MKQPQVHQRTLLLIFVAAAILVAAAPFAGASGITCRNGPGCLNGSYFIDWATNYGPPYSPIPNGSLASFNFPFSAWVYFAGGGDGERRDEGNGWAGNFTNGDALLWTNSPGQGPLILHIQGSSRKSAIGIGANIQTHFYGPFTALIQEFDRDGNLVDSFSEDGYSNPNGDGSAIFIGLLNDHVPFHELEFQFSITSCAFDCNDFAINQLDIAWHYGVPEPASLVLLGTGLFGVAGVTRKRLGRRS